MNNWCFLHFLWILYFAVIMRICVIQFWLPLTNWWVLHFFGPYFLQSSCGSTLYNFCCCWKIKVLCIFLDSIFCSHHADLGYIILVVDQKLMFFVLFWTPFFPVIMRIGMIYFVAAVEELQGFVFFFFGAYYLESSCGFALYNFCYRWQIDVFYTFLDPKFSSHHTDLCCIIFAAGEKFDVFCRWKIDVFCCFSGLIVCSNHAD